ncbi:MutS2 protein [Metarhizium rileyi]|uniref:DNA mismatch repair ATPase msh1 n=1 Tax=Metarhizium rileyi (strain RCEF 4871) TaxID=1649241 RepID=A0A162JEM5_METRR|nr:MutS2 protein [Metarhizium rileyi RCEF 4871]TWU76866.1 DNA mismatch repair ATPase msh1 [Metarhizium rileyi]
MFPLRRLPGARLLHNRGIRMVTSRGGPHPSVTPSNGATRLLQWRGAKTKTTIKLSDLPQGPIKSNIGIEPAEREEDEPTYPTVVLQARRNMRRFENCVLLTRVGGFYELYFEHADEYAPLLNLKLASKRTTAGPVPMAGFPFFQLDRFLKILVQDLNRYVAIAEEFPNDAAEKVKSGGLMHDRRVARIITPGTLIDENFIDPYASNYVLAIHVGDRKEAQKTGPVIVQDHGIRVSPAASSLPLGLAWLDLSTGHFFTQSSDLASLPSVLSRIGPREVILDERIESRQDHEIFSILAEDRHLITYSPQGGLTNMVDWAPWLESQIPDNAQKAFTSEEVLAGGLVLNYVKERLQGMTMKLLPPLRHESMQIMNIDKNSLRALEIKQTIRDGLFRGSLLHAIRRTVTKSGARLLNEWLSSPSTSLAVINARQNLVARFLASENLRDSVIMLLRRSHDSQRLVQKFSLGRGDADDLLALANTIRATEDIVALLHEEASSSADVTQNGCLLALLLRIDLTQPLKLARKIKDAIDEEGIVHRHEVEDSEASQMLALAQDIVATEGSQDDASSLPKGKKKRPTSIREYYAEDNEAWIMKPGASTNLKRLHSQLSSLIEEKIQLSDSLRERLGAPSLTLRWSPGLGHIAHIKGKDTKNLTGIRALSSSRSTTSFHHKEWTALGQRLDQARFHIRREEQRVFQSLREQVVLNLVKLRRNAAVLDELDITTSFARLAVEQNLVRPKLNNSTTHTIIGGRHPTVEGGLVEQGRNFVRNDCLVGSHSDGLLWLITGPNMAGKSTFLRQNALITILAQIGCYVPASYAELGIVDAIFSRVGSADNLYRDQSTFMVEMLETAQILKQATPRSFVIMDEIGRGTTPEDGTAVSYACLHHLVTVNQCRTLFATHFHAVADLAAAEGLCTINGGLVQLYCTDVEEDSQRGFVYVHKLRKGINRHSHALKVARLAGLPERVIDTAKQILEMQGATTTPSTWRGPQLIDGRV